MVTCMKKILCSEKSSKFLAEQEYFKGGHVCAKVRRMWNSAKDKTSATEGLVLHCQK